MGQQIEGEHQGQHQVHHQGEQGRGDADGGLDGGVEEGFAVGLEKDQNPFLNGLGVQGKGGQMDGMALQESHQGVPPGLQLDQTVREHGDEVHHAVLQSRPHDKAQGKEHTGHQQGADQQAHRALGFFLPGTIFLAPGPLPPPLHRAQENVEQKGQAPAQHKGQEEGKDGGQQLPRLAGMVQSPIEHQGKGDEQSQLLHRFPIEIHGTPPNERKDERN